MIYPDLFEKCITVVLLHEGGYVNNPSDYGGETKYGIAKRFFPQEDIKNLTIGEILSLDKSSLIIALYSSWVTFRMLVLSALKRAPIAISNLV
jgi:lysozyme family protein